MAGKMQGVARFDVMIDLDLPGLKQHKIRPLEVGAYRCKWDGKGGFILRKAEGWTIFWGGLVLMYDEDGGIHLRNGREIPL